MIKTILDFLGFNPEGIKQTINVRYFIFILVIIACIFIIIDITRMYYSCPKNKIEYRYLPKSFEDEQNNPLPLKDIFGPMFKYSSPWVNSFTNTKNIKSSRDTNFVSQ